MLQLLTILSFWLRHINTTMLFFEMVMENNVVPNGIADAVHLGVMPDPHESFVAACRRRQKYSQQPLMLKTLQDHIAKKGSCHVWVRKNKFGPLVPALVSSHVHGLVAIWRAGSKSEWLQEKDYGTRWVAYWDKASEKTPYYPKT